MSLLYLLIRVAFSIMITVCLGCCYLVDERTDQPLQLASHQLDGICGYVELLPV